MVVKEIKGDEVILISTTAFKRNDPTAPKEVVTKADYKDKIKMMFGEFIHRAEKGAGPTAEEIQDSNKALEEAAKDESEQCTNSN